ncbi:alpha/beta-hydrolase [Aspergillus heteromorphus CBS 117.55]|uniref:Alpha/beta-hydrolase n=1 Tax=Aspergillus heteromorphus CBS 117.55 TaxID=1448321 RepID=A0A317VBD9_9EURO|nr:alpha/beta-hydrolase [Aspergillus heteromorphus CBS 117.55]PWY71673.1 alpha/beta-hydrolase [Aspergillus heteromorphus CBS 117.55]
MTSHPPRSCCYQGVKHEGEATGSYSTLNDFEIYTNYPADKSTEHGILIITDVIGHRFINAQLIADQFAANGYFVMMPDLFDGDAIPLNRPAGFDLQAWLRGEYHKEKKGHLPADVDPIIEACITEMRSKYGVKKIGAVGYCFGGKYVVRHLHPEQGKIDAGYTAHPSFVTAEELKAIKGPLSISAAEVDAIFPTEKRHESEVILKDLGFPYQINLYSGVEHGFSVRGNPEKRTVQYAKESAFLQAVQWFKEHL